jgi:hypothetical protein
MYVLTADFALIGQGVEHSEYKLLYFQDGYKLMIDVRHDMTFIASFASLSIERIVAVILAWS